MPDEDICPKHKTPLVSTVGRADPIIDPGKVWDVIKYCLECVAEAENEEKCAKCGFSPDYCQCDLR